MRWFHKQLEDILIRLKWKKIQKDKLFKIADDVNSGLLPIEVLEGAYKGTIFTIKNLTVVDDDGKIKFDFEVVKKIPGTHQSYYGDQFAVLVGEILFVCLTESLTNYTDVRKEVLSDETDRDNYSEEFVEPRTIPSKGPTLSKK